MIKIKNFTALSLLLFCGLLLVGCSGYQLGSATLYHNEIRTVHVPMIQADSWRAGLGERLTEAVCKRIADRTPYQLADADKADTVLEVRLVAENQHASVMNRYNDTRQKTLRWTIIASWKDRRQNTIAQMDPIPLKSESVTINAESYLVAEMGQSGSTAQQEVIDRLANQIVQIMEEPW